MQESAPRVRSMPCGPSRGSSRSEVLSVACFLLFRRHRFYIRFVDPAVFTTMEPGPSRGPGVEVERAVPEVWCSSRRGSQSGEGVADLKSKRRGCCGAEVP